MTAPDGSTSPATLIARGTALHDAGRLAEATALCDAVLAEDPANADALHLRGAIAYRAGDPRLAITWIDRAIASAPANPRFHFNRGAILGALGDQHGAAEAYGRAATLAPGYADAHGRQAGALARLGRHAQALEAFDAARAAGQDGPDLHAGRGAALLALGRPAEAIAAFDRAIALRPDMAGTHLNRGAALRRLGRHADALDAYERSIAARPDFADAHFNRGNVLAALGRDADALASFNAASALAPGNGLAVLQAANMLFRLRRFTEALDAYDAGLRLAPGDVPGHVNRGTTLLELGRPEEALESSRHALALDPVSGIALGLQGNALAALRRFRDAVRAFESARATGHTVPGMDLALGNAYRIVNDPVRAREAYLRAAEQAGSAASAWFNIGNLERDAKNYEAAATCYDRAHDTDPGIDTLVGARIFNAMSIADWRPLSDYLDRAGERSFTEPRGFSPFALLGLVDDPAIHLPAARNWARKWVVGDQAPDVPDHPPGARIRLGYVSSDFKEHAVAFLIAGALEAHDRTQFDVTGLSIGEPRDDAMRRRIAAACNTFIECGGMSDGEIAALARRERIDIAIDLNGYSTRYRPGVFVRRCAPLQISYLGFPGTTGLPGMDYVIADPVVIPAGAERFYSEKVVRLPHSYQANDRRRPAGRRNWSRAELGLPDKGFVFCCFNNTFKILPDMFARWMRILAAVPGSMLWLLEDNPPATANLRAAAQRHGVDPGRIVFARRMELDDHLARHRQADLFLDTLPYNAHTTASDALWSGLPVLTLAGRSFAGRVAASLLRAVGLPELVADSAAAYEAMAIRLAHDPATLSALRTRLSANRMTTPLFDTQRFTRDLEAAYRLVHARRLRGLAPDHVLVGDAAAEP